MVNQRGIVANPKMIKAFLEMRSLSTSKKLQSVISQLIALSQFVSKVIEKYLPFSKVLKGNKRFLLNKECE